MDTPIWVPRSQLTEQSQCFDTGEWTLGVRDWIVSKNGWV
jgi:hypothetical protein